MAGRQAARTRCKAMVGYLSRLTGERASPVAGRNAQPVPLYLFPRHWSERTARPNLRRKQVPPNLRRRDFRLDTFKWLKEESLEAAADLPKPEAPATDAISELEGAVEELNAVPALLENGGKT
jgi:uncharacterized protein (DUF433 family)